MIPRLIAMCLLTVPVFAMPFERELGLPLDYANDRVSRLTAIGAGETVTLLDTDGPGAITHIWMTMGNHEARQVVLRMYWDGEEDPSVEAPLADFFGVGHNHLEPEIYFGTPAMSVAPKNGYNVYLPMPFRGSARITATNDGDEPLVDGGGLYFQADLQRYESLSVDTPYFHAQWRREAPAARRGNPYTVIAATGKGFIAGLTHHVRWDDKSDAWFHGGGDTVFLDGATRPVVLKGIGGEDFVGESWHSSVFVSPYAGCTNHKNGLVSMYRFFLEGPLRFEDSARLTLGAMENEMTSVGYWYQTGDHERFFTTPPLALRRPSSGIVAGTYDRVIAADQQLTLAVMGPFAGDIDTSIPFDGLETIDTSRSALTNYSRPYQHTIPEGDNRAVRWQRAGTYLGWLDLDAVYKPKMAGPRGVQALPGVIAYGLLRVESARNQQATLLVGHDDAVRIWLNGTQVADLDARDRFGLTETVLDFRRGRNEVLLKIANDWNTNWGAFALSIALRGGDGVTIDSFEELPAVP